jgi:hypothetical protein
MTDVHLLRELALLHLTSQGIRQIRALLSHSLLRQLTPNLFKYADGKQFHPP